MALLNMLQTTILNNLSIYGYLSARQLQRITGKSLTYLRESLAILRQRKLIASYHVTVTAKIRAENIYHLTSTGVQLVQENDKVFVQSSRLPANNSVLIIKDYHHRLDFISVFSSLVMMFENSDTEITLFQTYFDKTGNRSKDNNLTSATKIQLDKTSFFVPDGVMKTVNNNNVQKLYLIEMFCDTTNNTTRVINSLGVHAKNIALGSASMKYDIQANAIVLGVFAHATTLHSVRKRLAQNERFNKAMRSLFFFASLDDVIQDCSTAWQSINGETILID